jgi:hypothetical protein
VAPQLAALLYRSCCAAVFVISVMKIISMLWYGTGKIKKQCNSFNLETHWQHIEDVAAPPAAFLW